jgi:virulence-associated protein VapD
MCRNITPKGVAQAYVDIRATLGSYGFNWIQGSLYVSQAEDLTKLFSAIDALTGLAWLPPHSSVPGRAAVRLHDPRQDLTRPAPNLHPRRTGSGPSRFTSSITA